MMAGESRGTVKGRSSILKQTESFLVEGRADSTADPEGLGDAQLIRELGLEEDGGLCEQRRHWRIGAKA